MPKSVWKQLDEGAQEIRRLEAEAKGPGPADPAPQAPLEPSEAPQPPSDSKGAQAYALRRFKGLSWTEIGERLGMANALPGAKKHAKAYGLPWPPPTP